MMQRAYARLHQHDVRAKQTKVCDAERTGFPTPAYASIEAKRNLVTTPAKPGSYQLPSDRRANKFDRGFPSVDDFSNLKSGRSGLIVTNRLHKICCNYCVAVSECIGM